MTALAIIQAARLDGLRLSLTPARTIRAGGPREAVVRWETKLRQHKAELLRLLTSPPITPQDHDAMQDAIEERAAIRQFDGGEPCEVAEQQARAAMRVYQYRITDKPTSWLTLIAPGCDLDEAHRLLAWRFGGRLIEVIEHRAAALQAGGSHTPCSLPEQGRDE